MFVKVKWSTIGECWSVFTSWSKDGNWVEKFSSKKQSQCWVIALALKSVGYEILED